jgi:hypothetical protein
MIEPCAGAESSIIGLVAILQMTITRINRQGCAGGHTTGLLIG